MCAVSWNRDLAGDAAVECELALCFVFADQVEEELVDAGIVAEFGVEGSGEEVVLSDEDCIVVAGG